MKIAVFSTIPITFLFILSLNVCQAQEIKPYKTEEIKPVVSNQIKSTDKNKEQKMISDKSNINYFFGLYGYWIPGTSYTIPNYTNNQEVIHTSSGTGVLPGSIWIDANGTYIWNSSWDGKIIKGQWKLTGDADYPLELLKAQEGQNWRVGKSKEQGVAIIIWDRFTWYNGKKIQSSNS